MLGWQIPVGPVLRGWQVNHSLSGGWDRTIVADKLINQVDLFMVFLSSPPVLPPLPPHRRCVWPRRARPCSTWIEEPDGRLKPLRGRRGHNLTRALGLQGMGTLYLNPLSGDMLGGNWRVVCTMRAWPWPRRRRCVRPVRWPGRAGRRGQGQLQLYRDGVADRQVTAAALNAACAAWPELQVVATGCLALVAQDAAIYQPWLAARAAGRMVVVDANLRLSAVDDVGRPTAPM